MTRRARAWALVVGYCAVLFWLSSRPSKELPMPELFQVDKVLHLGAWFVLAVLVRRALALSSTWRAPVVTLAAIGFGVAYGAFDEAHQGLGSAGRVADPYDLLADAFGSILGATTHALFVRRLG